MIILIYYYPDNGNSPLSTFSECFSARFVIISYIVPSLISGTYKKYIVVYTSSTTATGSNVSVFLGVWAVFSSSIFILLRESVE